MASARKGGTCRHNTPRSYRLRRSATHPPTNAAVPAVRAIFEVTLSELLNMLREAENAIKKDKLVLYIYETNKKMKASKILKKVKGKERSGKVKVAKKDLAKDKR
ncbi:hypothetical protein BHE74_00027212 [Ensete ventricosum]|nr:hypothetical protein BHE74_00027212 [Ensete ventricosum]